MSALWHDIQAITLADARPKSVKEYLDVMTRHGRVPDAPLSVLATPLGWPIRTGAIKDETRWMVWARDDFRCCYYGSRRFLTVDHIWPRALGGTNTPSNLQTLCRTCNSRKWAFT